MGLLRAVLALLVIAAHTHGYPLDADLALIAVCTFFVISGALMPLSLEAHYSTAAKFYVSRALRIYPLYWLCLTAWLIEWVVTHKQPWSLYDVLGNYALLGVNESPYFGLPRIVMAPAWTLNLELQYYLLVPLMVLAVKRGRMWDAIFALTAAACVVLWVADESWTLASGRRLAPWFFFFYAGFAIWRYFPRLTQCLFRKRNGRLAKLDRYVGEFSYPLYIIHWPLVAVVLELAGRKMNFGVLLILNTAACLVVSWLALKLIVFPIDHWRRSHRVSRRDVDLTSRLQVSTRI